MLIAVIIIILLIVLAIVESVVIINLNKLNNQYYDAYDFYYNQVKIVVKECNNYPGYSASELIKNLNTSMYEYSKKRKSLYTAPKQMYRQTQ